jgi:hypothetical protein
MIYQLVPPALSGVAWTENVIWRFQGGTDGAIPEGQAAAAPAPGVADISLN